MKKLMSLCMVLIILCACMASGFSVYAYDEVWDEEDETILDEESIIANRPTYTVDDEFEDDGVLLTLTHAMSSLDPVFTPQDFEGLGVLDVRRITSDGSKYHIYYLTLDKHDKQNVLYVVNELNKIDGVLAAEPNLVLHLDTGKELSDELYNAIKEYENNENLEKSDISLHFKNLVAQDKYLVKYSQKDSSTSSDVLKIRIGEYKFTTSRPIPLIFTDNKLYEIKDAYEKGVIDDFDLLSISSFNNINFKKTELVYGDADGNWHLDISDATHIQRYLAQLGNGRFIDLELADIDKDGEVSVMDATAIQRQLAGLE